ncbi:MAG: type I-U CRISPR-associated protein Csx17 [Clostridia bacterium]|nr:type I-U CRISPR-associated protein Csx17 [Clostridia bacterium]MDH7572226.1 type I-U CRISPR-associated protein Csx17 [Clostridia bacterium]
MRGALLLAGCTPEPILAYLKALGVFRLVAEQKDPEARGAWSGGYFCLHTWLDVEELVRFFLDEYRPTPVLAPWNGGSGFWGHRTAAAALDAVRNSTHPRLDAYRKSILRAEAVLAAMGLSRRPPARLKPELLRRMRSALPDEAVPWIDAVCALTEDRMTFAPLLGTGGNDGNLEFSSNFMQRLADVVPFAAGGWPPSRRGRAVENPRERSRRWLEASLFAAGNPPLVRAAIGQFHPGGVGGPNATQGFEGDSVVNPWDYVLMVEGALLMAGSVARRLGSESRRKAAFPFTVRSSAAGWPTLASGEAEGSRGYELWLPLWERPALLAEVAHLMAEGRAQVGARPAATGADFARAVVGLGVDRGLAGFWRFAFVRRSGKAYIAAPLGYLSASPRTNVHLLEEVDPWLERLRWLSRRRGAPESLRQAERAVDEAVFRFCRDGHPRSLQGVLAALAGAQRAVAQNPGARERIPPLQGLGRRWLEACADGSTEFRLARALASLRASWRGQELAVGPLRMYLEPVRVDKRTGRFEWHVDSPSLVWAAGNTVSGMAAVLARRLLEARRAGIGGAAALEAACDAPLSDVQRFLAGEVSDRRLETLVRAFLLLDWTSGGVWPAQAGGEPEREVPPEISRLYALVKLLFHPARPHKRLAEDDGWPLLAEPDLALLARLRAGDAGAAVRIAARRLRARGHTLVGTAGSRRPGRVPLPVCPPSLATRVAAALLIPVSDRALRGLAELVLRTPEDRSRLRSPGISV